LNFFWCDVTTGAGQRIVRRRNQGLRKKFKWQLPVFSFKINWAKIRVFRALIGHLALVVGKLWPKNNNHHFFDKNNV